MLRINLLPPYVYAGAKRRTVFVVWIVVLLAVIGGFVFGKIQIDNQIAQLEQETQGLEPTAAEAKQKQAEADRIKTESKAIVDKRDFVTNAQKHTRETYPPVVFNIRDYTIRNVLYSSLSPQQQTVTLAAYAPTLAKVGHYLMWMEHNPNVSSVNISISGLPSFPVSPGFNGQPQGSGPRPPRAGGYDFQVSLQLVKPIAAAPTFGGGGGGAPQGGGGMMGMGGPMGMGGGPMGGAPPGMGPMGAPGGMPGPGGMSAPMAATGGMTSAGGGAPMAGAGPPMGGGGGRRGGEE